MTADPMPETVGPEDERFILRGDGRGSRGSGPRIAGKRPVETVVPGGECRWRPRRRRSAPRA